MWEIKVLIQGTWMKYTERPTEKEARTLITWLESKHPQHVFVAWEV